MDISGYLPFSESALNASFLIIIFLIIPFPLMVFSAIKMKFVTKKSLITLGFGFIVLSLLFTPLFTGTIDIISSFESQLKDCQAEYVYKKAAEIEELPICKDLTDSQSKDLSGFKDFVIIISVFVTVIVLSLGVNLIASAISMSQDRLALEELYNKVDEIKVSVDKQTNILKIFLGIIIFLLSVTIYLLFKNNG